MGCLCRHVVCSSNQVIMTDAVQKQDQGQKITTNLPVLHGLGTTQASNCLSNKGSAPFKLQLQQTHVTNHANASGDRPPIQHEHNTTSSTHCFDVEFEGLPVALHPQLDAVILAHVQGCQLHGARATEATTL